MTGKSGKLTLGIAFGSDAKSGEATRVDGLRKSYEYEVPGDTADLPLACNLDLTKLKIAWLKSSRDMVVKTNSDSVPDDEFILLAGESIGWAYGMAVQPIFSEDITGSIYVSVAAGDPALLEMEFLVDPEV